MQVTVPNYVLLTALSEVKSIFMSLLYQLARKDLPQPETEGHRMNMLKLLKSTFQSESC